MGIPAAAFWRLTLAEWRASLAGYDQRESDARYRAAWSLSYMLVAAGCDSDKVSPEKLLGLPEPKVRKSRAKAKLSPQELLQRMRRVDGSGKPVETPGEAGDDGRTV